MNTPLSYLQTYGPAGDPVTRLGWGLIAVSMAVVVIVSVLLVWGIVRRRPVPSAAEGGERLIGRGGAGLRFLYIGVGVSTVVLVLCAFWSLRVLANVGLPRAALAADALNIEVTGYQWWWEVRYHDERNPSRGFVTANEIHIPVGRPVRFSLRGVDVIHSFWVPRLAGKVDIIPGQLNHTWLQADAPGVYRGQCGEYCGLQHAHMAFVVVADPPERFEQWRNAQLAGEAASEGAGRDLFMARCSACHAAREIGAGGRLGPDLSHLMSRKTLAAGTLENTPENLTRWIADPQAIKPGNRMPRLGLSSQELAQVTQFLETLR